MANLILQHPIDKSFIQYGLVIYKSDFNKSKEILLKALKDKITIKIHIDGKVFEANVDSPRSTLYRLMWRNKNAKLIIQEKYKDLYDFVGKDDVKIKDGVKVKVGIFETDVPYEWEIRELTASVLPTAGIAKPVKPSPLPMPDQIIYYGTPGCGKSHYVREHIKEKMVEFNLKSLSNAEIKEYFTKFLVTKISTVKPYIKGFEKAEFLKWVNKVLGTSYKNIYDIRNVSEISKLQSHSEFNAINHKVTSNGSLSACVTKYIEFLTLEDLSNVFRTTFHPDTDYSSFVGTYKPQMTGEGDNKKIVYSFAPQVFTDAYIAAWKNPSVPVFLIIEEINRGNCAQIFGDLFQLLDRDKTTGESEYPIKASGDLRIYLQEVMGAQHDCIRAGELRLPRNLNIIATMNTSDQSLFPMDSAFKRRWQWKYMKIDYKHEESGKFRIKVDASHEYSWNKFLKAVNARIYDLTKSEDKQIGNFFIKEDADFETFVSKVMFFLWSEICKEEVGNKRSFYFTKFRYDNELPTAQDKWDFKFSDLYGDNAKEILIGFMEYLEVKPE